MRTGLRIRRHRATTANLCSAYPFGAGTGLGTSGAYLGADASAGGAGFYFDPFSAYGARLVSNPNVLVAGEPGSGKSATLKCLLHRVAAVSGRWVAVADPKGEYRPLAERLGLALLALRPGGPVRLNPLDVGRPGAADDPAGAARRQAAMVAALAASMLGRALAPVEDAALGWALGELSCAAGSPTLVDVAALLDVPSEAMAARARTTPAELARSAAPVRWALGKLLDGSLRGMFDGPTNVALDPDGPGVVLDLSGLADDAEAQALVMVAAAAFLQSLTSRPAPAGRILVLDEAWSLLASEHTARWLASCWKLGRARGVANVAVLHRLSDLRAQADDGTATAKVATGLLADTATRVLFRQSPDQVPEATALLGLSSTEAQVLWRLCRGRALWRLGAAGAVVQHAPGPGEGPLCDTDAAMAA